MGKLDNEGTVTLQELLVTSLAQSDTMAKLLIEKGVITQDEFTEKIKAEVQILESMSSGIRAGLEGLRREAGGHRHFTGYQISPDN